MWYAVIFCGAQTELAHRPHPQHRYRRRHTRDRSTGVLPLLRFRFRYRELDGEHASIYARRACNVDTFRCKCYCGQDHTRKFRIGEWRDKSRRGCIQECCKSVDADRWRRERELEQPKIRLFGFPTVTDDNASCSDRQQGLCPNVHRKIHILLREFRGSKLCCCCSISSHVEAPFRAAKWKPRR